jgi:hypothetical protein
MSYVRLATLMGVAMIVHGCTSESGGSTGEPGTAGPLVEMERLINEEERAGCACYFSEEGYASVEECVADVELPPLFDVRCLARVWPENAAVLGPEIECSNEAQRDYLSCSAMAACDETAEDACNETALDALLGCPAAGDDAWAAFERQYERCLGG